MTEFMKKLTKQDIRNTIAVFYIIGAFAFLFRIANHPIPEQNKSSVDQAQGYVLCGMGIILGYYFVTSKQEVERSKREHDDSGNQG